MPDTISSRLRSWKGMATLLLAALLLSTLLHPVFRPYLIFFLLNGLVLINAVILYTNLDRSSTWTDTLLGMSVIALSQITVTQLYLGLAGYLTLFHVSLAQVICLGLTMGGIRMGWLRSLPLHAVRLTIVRMYSDGLGLVRSHRATTAACLISFFIFIFVFGISALNPPIGFDAIFYHLVQPVEWLQHGKIPVQFSPTEARPHGIGLITTWLLLPFHHDFFARWSQVGFILLGALASYGICRNLEIDRRLAFVTAAAVLTLPEYLASGITLTQPDTQVAGMVPVALYFGLSYIRQCRLDTCVLLALSSGLALSANITSLAYAVPFVLLAIYVWCKNAIHPGSYIKQRRAIMLHILILIGIPLVVGGITYLYYQLTVGPLWSLGYHSIHTFHISSFVLSPKSLKEVGFGVLSSGIAIYGLRKILQQRRWDAFVVVSFVILQIFFSLAVYTRYGHGYEGPRATRHLLTTIVCCVILAGWGISHLKGQAYQYGLWGLVGVIAIAACLGIARQWPIHRVHTRILSIVFACMIAMAFQRIVVSGHAGFLRILKRACSPLGIMLSIWLLLLGLHGWEYAYREHKYYTWPTWFGFGSNWGLIAQMTEQEGAHIAHNVELYNNRLYGLYAPYPLYGADLQNTLTLLRADVDPAQSPGRQAQGLRKWERALHARQIDYVYIFRLGSLRKRAEIVVEWMKAHPETFVPIHSSGLEHVYRLTTSPHHAQAP